MNKKALKFVITLGTGSFDSSSNNQITLTGLRATAEIDKAGGQMSGTLRARIYGVSQSHMNSITTLQLNPNYIVPNTIQVFAIDGSQTSLVFQGNILNAWGNYQNQPDVFLEIQAISLLLAKLTPVPPLSFQGTASVATIMQQLAQSMGQVFENNGVSTQLSNVYLPNTALEQAKSLARAAGCWMYIDDTVLGITPQNTARANAGQVPLVSSSSGLYGYPTFDGLGVNFQMLFNPSVRFMGKIQLQSSIPKPNGTWIVTSITHRLESEKLNGAWFSTVRGNLSGILTS